MSASRSALASGAALKRFVQPRVVRSSHRLRWTVFTADSCEDTLKLAGWHRARSMAPESQAKLAFGRAFLIELERGDRDLAPLFAKAFLAQGAVVTESSGPAGEKSPPRHGP